MVAWPGGGGGGGGGEEEEGEVVVVVVVEVVVEVVVVVDKVEVERLTWSDVVGLEGRSSKVSEGVC